MDTVSMLNKMSFYCQPILPLVYDESMSYYETLCKVVGQLNTTGETVNKLNEGLTGEIADRQAADAELDERLKVIEDTNKKIHFLVFDGANPNGGFPTRHELYQWVEAGDAIFTLLGTYEEGRGQIYAASCSYNAGNWGSEASNDFSIIVPLETTYDSTGKLAVKQKIVKLTIPPIPQTNLNAPWGLQIIEINTPSTSAEGIVNFSATVDNENTVHANLSPAEFTYLYRAVSKGSGLIVGVNAQLTTNDSQLLLSTTADIIGGETASDDEVRIVFDAETSTGERGLDLPYLNRLIYILSGSGTSETWTLTEFETYDFAFDRYEGFQFTRAANNAITPAFGSTPKDVAEYFVTVKGGTPYQNLPVRLIDTVDGAEYWNGVFDIKDGNHMTFTFVTSNYVTASGKMLVRVIELSADSNATTWKYAAKEFELPITDSFTVDDALSDTSTNPVQNKVVKAALDSKLSKLGGEISGNLEVGLTVGAGGSVSTGVTSSDSGIHFEKAASDAGRISHGTAGVDDTVPLARLKVASPTEDDDAATKAYVDNNAAGAGSFTVDDALSDTSTNPVQNKVVKAALDSKLSKLGGEISGNLEVGLTVGAGGSVSTGVTSSDSGIHFEKAASDAGRISHGTAGVDDTVPLARLKVASPTENDDAATKAYVDNNAAGAGAVRYDAAQTLTFEQQKQARRNIDAAPQNTPNFTGYITLTPPNGDMGHGVGMTASVAGGGHRYALNISDVDEGEPTLLTGLKTPTDAQTNAAATVEYVMNKVAGRGGGSADPTEAMQIATKKYVDDHAGGTATKVTLSGTVEGEVVGYTSATYQQIVDEIAKTGNIWLTISGETVRLASYKQSGASSYTLVFFGAGDGALTVKYEVTASASSASLTVTGS